MPKTKKSAEKVKKTKTKKAAPIAKQVSEASVCWPGWTVSDKKLTRELKRVFGKKLKPTFVDLGGKLVFEFSMPKRATNDAVRSALMGLLSSFPDMP
jgi:hypothetical protein